MPSRSSPSTTSAAFIAPPQSRIVARGTLRFWIPWQKPWTRSSLFSSSSYHCAWQHTREQSSRMPNR